MPKNYRIISKGDAVRQARVSASYDLASFASLTRLARTTISMIENGHGTTEETAHRIAQALQKPFTELFEVISIHNNGNGSD